MPCHPKKPAHAKETAEFPNYTNPVGFDLGLYHTALRMGHRAHRRGLDFRLPYKGATE